MLKHVLIVPDGNRRYAKKERLAYETVYRLSSEVITTNLIDYILVERKIPELSVYAISYDNVTKRGSVELDPIYKSHIKTYDLWAKNERFKKEKIAFVFKGALKLLPKEYREAIKVLEEISAGGTKKCNILVSYDGQWDIIQALKCLNKKGVIQKEELYNYLCIKSPIDMIVRTGCEKRLSNAPLYQSSYAEIFFTDFYYPELSKEKMGELIDSFHEHRRRFGK